MKLRTRLALLVGIVTIVGGGVIGGASALVARAEGISSLDHILKGALKSVVGDSSGDITRIIGLAVTSPVRLSAIVFYANSEPVALVEGSEGATLLKLPVLSVEDVKKAVSAPQTKSGDIEMRIAASATGDGEWLVLGASMETVEAQFHSILIRSIELSLTIALAMVIIVYFGLRRSLHRIAELTLGAQLIADGNLDAELPRGTRNDEIGALNHSLVTMVSSLRDALATTQQSELKMREFLGDTSHELRTPITVIRGYVDILNSGQQLSSEQHERAMSHLVSQAQRMSRTIDDLLLLAELGEVRQEMSSDVDLSAVVLEHIEQFEVEHPLRRVTSTISHGVTVRGDIEQVSRMMSNILTNIARHTSSDVEVAVSLSIDDDLAVLVVNDAGDGLSPELYSRSVDGFQRFDRAHSKNGGGFGLGLSILSSIVQRLHGKLLMNPGPLGGLCTQITLPVIGKPVADI